jgi:formylglycine-generating enzyme required for sulfatase activity
MWTLVNRGTTGTSGDQLVVPHDPSVHYYDLWHGTELTPRVAGGRATLSFDIEAKGFGGVLASRPQDLPAGFKGFLQQLKTWSKRPLASYSAANTVLPQQLTPISSTPRRQQAPAGTVAIPAANYPYAARGTEIEGENLPGVGIQLPWESQPSRYHAQTVPIKPFYIDRTPVTNAQYQRFMDATGYRPSDDHNFLKDWDWTNRKRPAPRPGWGAKPVTWVSIEDSRAYASWAGRRLPHTWEWQYAAQGLDGRSYPWGNAFDPSRVPETFSGRGTMRPPADVGANPDGASPFGALDMVGNVWQWTDELTDAHTRTAVLRGGSYYRALGSGWYFPSDENAYRLDHQNKYLLMSPGRDRAATIGFRTVADAAAAAAEPAGNGTVVDDDAPGWTFAGWSRYTSVDAFQETARGGSGANGQSAEYTFTGTGVDVYGWRGPNGGTIRILLDGRPLGGTASQYATTDRYHQLLGRIGGLPPGRHTVRIEADPATKASQWTMVDYLRVYAARDAQPPAPPRLTVDRPVLAGGSTATVTATFRNESATAVSGTLRLTAPPHFTVAPAGQRFSRLAPHAEVTARFTVRVPTGAPTGAQLLRATAALDGRADAESWTTLAVLGAADPLRATGGRGNVIDLAWRSVDPESRATYQVHASTTAGFTPDASTLVGTTTSASFQHIGLDTDQTWYYRVRATDGATAVAPWSAEAKATSGPIVIAEAESLVPPTEATAPYEVQPDCCGISWSGGRQVWFQAARPGDRYTLTFSVPRTRNYDLTLIYTKASDFGIQTRTLDGTPLGAAYDHGLPSGVALDRAGYGSVALAAGSHTLTFTVTGKRDTSPRYGFGLDAIELRPS